jgi:hypothetical protein
MTDGTLTLQDIADLARVQRPVVSMWRRRRTVGGVEIPFPKPVPGSGAQERFDRDEVVAWLEATRRGNNVEARQDAPALSVPTGTELEAVVVLLCLHALAGEELAGLNGSELVELAERVDPDDELLLREVRELTDAAALGRFVDDLVEASFGLGDALDRLESGRLRRESTERGLNRRVVELVRVVAQACRLHLGDDGVAVAPHGYSPLAEKLAEGFAGLLLDGDEVWVRSQRRRARLREIELLDDGNAVVRVLSTVGDEPDVALDAIDDLAVSLGPSDIGIVLGAASVLCDRLVSAAEGRRAQTLRPGALAIAIRLSRGMWKGAHRQHLALWVLQGSRRAQSLYMADLDGLHVDSDDLAADVIAALELTERRAYRYARRGDLAPVLAGTVPVVPRGVRALQVDATTPSTHLDAVHVASLVTSRTINGYDVTVAPAPSRIVLRQRSLRELADAGQLIMRRGSRIDPAHAAPGGTVPVLTADQSTADVRLDPLDAERHYPRATRTEPGDVIFSEQPYPAAWVDRQGGALVASPSRLLRLRRTATIGPHTLAALINELAIPGTEWETWSVPDLPPIESRALDGALHDASNYLVDLRQHEQAARDLTRSLIQGVAAGTVTIDPTITQKAG